MVETIAVTLTGANFAFEASSFFDEHGGPPNVGQFVIAIDPAAFSGTDLYFDRLSRLIEEFDQDPGTRLPGSRRLALREAAKRDGVQVEDAMVQSITELADSA